MEIALAKSVYLYVEILNVFLFIWFGVCFNILLIICLKFNLIQKNDCEINIVNLVELSESLQL